MLSVIVCVQMCLFFIYFFISDLSFNFGFTIRVNGNYQSGHLLDIYVGESFLEQVKLKHNIEDIRFLTLSGDVTKINKLDFQFA